jgi:hypothetical protein
MKLVDLVRVIESAAGEIEALVLELADRGHKVPVAGVKSATAMNGLTVLEAILLNSGTQVSQTRG